MEGLKSIVVIPTEILCEDWVLDEDDNFAVFDFNRFAVKPFDHEPSKEEILKAKGWWPLVIPLCKEDKKSIRKYIKQNKHCFSKEERKMLFKILKQKWFAKRCDEIEGYMRFYFTQEEFADMLEIPQETVQQIIERNRIKPSKKWTEPCYRFDEFIDYYARYEANKK